MTMSIECVLARSIVWNRIIVSASSWALDISGCSLTPVFSTTFTNWPLLKPPVSMIHWCSLTICGAVSIKYTHMNFASADVLVAFLILFSVVWTYYVGVVSLSVYGGFVPAA